MMNYQAEKLAEWQKEAQAIIDRDLTPGQTYQAQIILALIDLANRQEKTINLMVAAMAKSWIGGNDD